MKYPNELITRKSMSFFRATTKYDASCSLTKLKQHWQVICMFKSSILHFILRTWVNMSYSKNKNIFFIDKCKQIWIKSTNTTSEAETAVNITVSKTIPFLATESQSTSFIYITCRLYTYLKMSLGKTCQVKGDPWPQLSGSDLFFKLDYTCEELKSIS